MPLSTSLGRGEGRNPSDLTAACGAGTIPNVETLILTQTDLEGVLTIDLAIQAVEAAFGAHGRGEAVMPSKVYLPLEQHKGDFRAMPAYFGGTAGLKWVNAHPQNPSQHALPTVMGLYLLNDPDTGAPLAVMDATLLTAFRTGAAGGVASRHLARGASTTLGLIGCGVQARTLLAAHRRLYTDLRVCAADVSGEAAERFAQEVGGQAVMVETAAGCDLVCTSTPCRSPALPRAWLQSGAHINAMGADAPGKQELDPTILYDARVFVDDLEQGCESGEVNVSIREGEYTREQITGTLGEVIAGKKRGRTAEDEITLFDSTGLAVQDVALATLLYEEALRQGIGREVEFSVI